VATFPIDVTLDPAGVRAGARRAKGELRGVRQEGERTQSTLLKLFSGAALGVGIQRGISLLADFSQQMSTVQAVSRATETEFRQLQATAERLGRTTRFSASQAAEGMTFLARAGFSASEVLGTIEGTLQLAQAGALGLGQAADIASNVLQGFQLNVAETGRVVDVLALGANSANTSVSQLGNALSFAAPVASGLGVSLEETTSAIGALSNAGVQGSRAGTGLNRVLAELENPAAGLKGVLEELGLAADEVSISNVGLAGALKVLADANIDTGQALAAFGQRGGPAANILIDLFRNTELADSAFVQFTGSLENADGTAQRIADTMDDNLNGAILSARSALEGFIIAVGNAGATEALVMGAQGLATTLRFAADNADILVVGLGAYVAATALAAAANSTLVASTVASTQAFFAKTAQLRVSTIAMIAASGAARTLGAGLLALAANPVVIGVTAVVGAFLLLRDTAKDTGDEIQKTESLLQQYQKTASSVERDTDLLRRRNEELAKAIKSTGEEATEAVLLERDAIRRRIGNNRKLLREYQAQLRAQLAVTRATQKTNDVRALSDVTGLRRESRQVQDFGAGTGPSGISTIRESEASFISRATRELERQAELAVEADQNGMIISDRQVKILEFTQRRRQELEKINGLEEAIAALDPSSEFDEFGGLSAFLEDQRNRPPPPPPSAGSAASPDFDKQFSELQSLTNAIGENEAALERRNGVLEFARELERDLTAEESARVDAELRRQQVLTDNQAFEQRAQDIARETTLIGENAREAEILAEIYDAERNSLLGLSTAQEQRIRNLVEEGQAARDDATIQQRLDTLGQEAQLLMLVGTEARVMTEVLRLQNQLQRDLTETEVDWIDTAIRTNEELERRNRILTNAQNPTQQAKDDLRSLIDLYEEGRLSLQEFNRELQDNQVANDVARLDQQLGASGFGVGPSAFEEQRRNAELAQRAQEGGGIDDGFGGSFFGLGADALGVGDEAERLREQTQQRLELLREAREQELLTEQEFIERKNALFESSNQQQTTILQRGLNDQLQGAQNLFGSLADIARQTAGEQSGIYRGLVAVQRAAGIAQATIAISTAIAQGIQQSQSLPFPGNIAAIATTIGAVTAQTAGIISTIRGVQPNFRDGGLPGGVLGGVGGPREDSNLVRVSRGEFIANAESTRRNLPLLQAINDFGRNRTLNFRDGGLVTGRDLARPRRAANDNIPRAGIMISVEGINIQMPESADRDTARELGEEAGRAFVRSVIQEESRYGGLLDPGARRAS